MQSECVEDTRVGADTRRKKRRNKKLTSGAAPFAAQTSAFDGATFTGHLAADLAGDLIEAFARDYSEGDEDRALADLLFSVRGLKTDYERRAAGAALESLAGRIEAGIREYPNLVYAAEGLANGVAPDPPDGTDRQRALHAARTVIRPFAAELSKRPG